MHAGEITLHHVDAVLIDFFRAIVGSGTPRATQTRPVLAGVNIRPLEPSLGIRGNNEILPLALVRDSVSGQLIPRASQRRQRSRSPTPYYLRTPLPARR